MAEYYPSIEVMDAAAKRLGAPNSQSFLAVASDSMKSAFKVICELIGRHEPPEGSPEAERPREDEFEIPAALSAFPGMKGFRREAAQISAQIDVLLDGEPQSNVIAYDIDAGTVTRFTGSTDGMVSLKRAKDPANHERLTGTVTVIERN